MRVRLAGAVLASVLLLVFGWPAVATVAEAWRGASGEAGGGLMGPADEEAGRIVRPLDLAGKSVALVLWTAAMALPVGVPLALVLFRTDAWGRRPMLGLLALAAFVPMPLHAAAWIGAFGNAGRMQVFGGGPILVGVVGAAFVHAVAAIPWIVLLAGVGMATVEPELEEEALLELPAWRVLAAITLRRSLGAIAGAALAVAVLAAGDMTVTDLLQVRTYAEEAYVQFQVGQGPAVAAAVALPPLAALGGLLVLAAYLLMRTDPARLASAAEHGKTWRLGRWRIPVGIVLIATVGVLTVLPVATLVWRAGRVGGMAAIGKPPRWSGTGLLGTLRIALLEVCGVAASRAPDDPTGGDDLAAIVLDDPLANPLAASMLWSAAGASAAVVLAWALAWASRTPGAWRWVAVACTAVGLATPGPVAGMALVFGFRGWRAAYDSAAMFVLADVLRTLPYALLVLWPAVRLIPPALLESAALDGLDGWGQAWRVAIPSTRGAIVAAWGVAFVLSLGELPATNLVAPPGVTPIMVVLWGLLHTGVESHTAGVALVMLAAVAVAGLFATWALARLGVIPGGGRHARL